MTLQVTISGTKYLLKGYLRKGILYSANLSFKDLNALKENNANSL